MKAQNRIRKNRSAKPAALQAAKQSTRAPAEFKIVRLRECPVDDAAMDHPAAVEKVWRQHVMSAPAFSADKECLVVFLLNTRRRVMGFEMLSQGTKDTLLVNTAEVFRLATAQNASAIVIAHNHPSGDSSPSEADIKTTRDLIRAGALLKIDLLDHVVMGAAGSGRSHTSLRDLGYFWPAGDAPPVGESAKAAATTAGGDNAGMMFLWMEEDVNRAMALLELQKKEMQLLLDDGQDPQGAGAGLGFMELANDCADALYTDWKEACDEARRLRDEGVRCKLVNGRWPATDRLDISVAEAVMLIDRFGNELEQDYDERDRRDAEREKREPCSRFGYLTLARRCGESLRKSFKRAWAEWYALDKKFEQRQAA